MNPFQPFGLKRVINASGKMTALGGSAVQPEVAQAMAEAAQDYVEIDQLLVAAGREIAKATGAEDGCPTTGAAAGMAIATAAVIAGTNLQRIEQLPVSAGLPNEIVLQKGHAVHFGAAITQMIALGGGKPVEVGHANHTERAHFEEAINERTAALLFVQSHHAVQKGVQSLETLRDIASARGIPLIVDAAAEEDMRKYVALGADLVCYSGGKALGGPTSGFVCGRKDLIEACRAQYKGIGRAMKVGKEAIVGLLTALRQYGESEEAGESQKRRMEQFLALLEGVPGIKGGIARDESGRAIYRAKLEIDPAKAGLTAKQLIRQLESGDPAIYTRNHYSNVGIVFVDPRPLLPDQECIIAERIRDIVTGGITS
ncbi:DgaE family pyridoxal phosphate-dependent ammonia lyase [Paenibacillus flagellatus]|uniref:SelA-like pyridoxal phosphate-dependent enzyme n=1 Tax=Paenibacillus flagellatus TaxID=2211139 RepID=A0A2V5KNI5_9BACL|nr:DgaE family pyridoxal phosphate-dependent ammonia lyase [Paenibacillus flagellatus]PYI52667.1 SelA-like pyridoxal phosphate-dependent enzyme [Paenibacillus flagellatus]